MRWLSRSVTPRRNGHVLPPDLYPHFALILSSPTQMAHSLSEECTLLKREYDACFNAWFEGYLEPAVSASSKPEERQKFAQAKAAEYERTCGKVWAQYRECVQVRAQALRCYRGCSH